MIILRISTMDFAISANCTPPTAPFYYLPLFRSPLHSHEILPSFPQLYQEIGFLLEFPLFLSGFFFFHFLSFQKSLF